MSQLVRFVENILYKQHIVQSKQCTARCFLHLWWYFLQGGGAVLKQACQPFPLPWLQVSEREMKPFHFVVVNSLRLYKLRRGDVLAVFLENRPEYVGVLLGLSKVQNTVQHTKYHKRWTMTNALLTLLFFWNIQKNKNIYRMSQKELCFDFFLKK